ncbi:hypothetical protein [Teredinibacter turnerae]|uniref:hypothetical protein n=1 Tax=Teredinibacter turnerae TaxID=2426 RepID=UPI00035DD3D9|nr:hypothetical protein [Teredinibacter turnerae]
MKSKHGKLAQEFFGVALENEVLKSARGYHIGTADPEKGPISRESEEYWRSENKANQALVTGTWTQRIEP